MLYNFSLSNSFRNGYFLAPNLYIHIYIVSKYTRYLFTIYYAIRFLDSFSIIIFNIKYYTLQNWNICIYIYTYYWYIKKKYSTFIEIKYKYPCILNIIQNLPRDIGHVGIVYLNICIQ